LADSDKINKNNSLISDNWHLKWIKSFIKSPKK